MLLLTFNNPRCWKKHSISLSLHLFAIAILSSIMMTTLCVVAMQRSEIVEEDITDTDALLIPVEQIEETTSEQQHQQQELLASIARKDMEALAAKFPLLLKSISAGKMAERLAEHVTCQRLKNLQLSQAVLHGYYAELRAVLSWIRFWPYLLQDEASSSRWQRNRRIDDDDDDDDDDEEEKEDEDDGISSIGSSFKSALETLSVINYKINEKVVLHMAVRPVAVVVDHGNHHHKSVVDDQFGGNGFMKMVEMLKGKADNGILAAHSQRHKWRQQQKQPHSHRKFAAAAGSSSNNDKNKVQQQQSSSSDSGIMMWMNQVVCVQVLELVQKLNVEDKEEGVDRDSAKHKQISALLKDIYKNHKNVLFEGSYEFSDTMKMKIVQLESDLIKEKPEVTTNPVKKMKKPVDNLPNIGDKSSTHTPHGGKEGSSKSAVQKLKTFFRCGFQ